MSQTHTEKTSADKKMVGFDYQYWFFLWKVLRLRSGESIGLEVADDVHTQLNNNFQVLFQLKHTLKKNASGESVKLTKYDPDLWKTLSNWSKVISDTAAGRASVADQLSFLKKTEFVLVSNKSDLTEPSIIELFSDPTTAVATLQSLKLGTKSEAIQGYLDDVLKLDETVLLKFVERTSFLLAVDEMIERCETAILEAHIPPKRVKQLLRDIDSQIRQDNFLCVKEGNPVTISFETFNKKYRGFFDDARSTRLRPRNDYDPLPHSLEMQTFIRQLIDITDLGANDLARITKLSICKQTLEKNLTTWELEGDITRIDLEAFERDALTRWENAFNTAHRDRTIDGTVRGLSVLDAIRLHSLNMRGETLDAYVSNGQFYRLADIPVVGFLLEWEELYGRALV